MSNGHDTQEARTNIGMASATLKPKRKNQTVPVSQVRAVLGLLKETKAFKGLADSKILVAAGIGGTTLIGWERSGEAALQGYLALVGLLSEQADAASATPALVAAKSRNADEAALLFDACRLASKARPHDRADYQKLMGHYAQEMVRLIK